MVISPSMFSHSRFIKLSFLAISLNKSDFISTDEDPGLRIESFAIIKLRGVSTKLNIIFFHHANFQEIKLDCCTFKDAVKSVMQTNSLFTF